MQTHVILVILVQIHTTLLCLPPSLRHSVIDIGLVNDLRYKLRSVVDAWRIRGGDVSTVNGVGGAVFDKKSEESEDGADKEDSY